MQSINDYDGMRESTDKFIMEQTNTDQTNNSGNNEAFEEFVRKQKDIDPDGRRRWKPELAYRLNENCNPMAKQLAVVLNSPDAVLPKKATPGSGAYDLYSIEECLLYPNERRVLDTGVSMAIPVGFVGEVCSRSGMAFKNGVIVLNAPGILDSDYRLPIKVILWNTDREEVFRINKGDRIAQLLFKRAESFHFNVVQSLDETTRTGGLGSTGK